MVNNSPAKWETWVWSLGWEDPLEKGKATHSSILVWRIPYSPWGHKGLDTTKRLSLALHFSENLIYKEQHMLPRMSHFQTAEPFLWRKHEQMPHTGWVVPRLEWGAGQQQLPELSCSPATFSSHSLETELGSDPRSLWPVRSAADPQICISNRTPGGYCRPRDRATSPRDWFLA